MTQQIKLYNIDAEKAVLGSIILDATLLQSLPLRPEFFTPGRHQILWNTFKEMNNEGKAIDVITIADHIGDSYLENIGGVQYILELTNGVFSSVNVQQYSDLLVEYYQERTKAKIAEEMLNGLPLSEAMLKLQDLQAVNVQANDGNIKKGLKRVAEKIINSTGGITGIPSRFRDLDKMTSGWQNNNLIIVAARPSVGKSAFANNLALNAVRKTGRPEGAAVAIFSLEMGEEELLLRMTSTVSHLDSQRINDANLVFTPGDWTSLWGAMDEIGETDLHIFDDTGITVDYIITKSREMKKQYKGQPLMIIIDYLQLVRGSKKSYTNRQEEVSDISRSLKSLARELQAPVIALSQLSRGVEQRQDKRPMMSDLRESGSLEQDADIVSFLYREDYYDKETEDQNMIEIIIAKHRNGPTGTVKLAYVKEFSKFVTIDWSNKQN